MKSLRSWELEVEIPSLYLETPVFPEWRAIGLRFPELTWAARLCRPTQGSE